MEGKMNLEEYFKRIGLHGSFDKPDLATLKLIHKQHVMSIPFENLSIHCGERIIMDLEVIFNKIVRNGRGGWCLENNFLFGWVLREMGYDTTTLGSRVFIDEDFSPFESHLINKVIIEGKPYIADVSLGGPHHLWEPLELVSGKDQPQEAGVFRVIDKGDIWILEKTSRKPEVLNPDFAKPIMVSKEGIKLLFCFTLVPREADHFYEENHKHQTDPDSLFTKHVICALQTPTGYRMLVDETYCETTYKPEEGVDVFDMRKLTDDEIEQIIPEKFSIKLQNKLQHFNHKPDLPPDLL